jgi:cation transport regulator ChaC
VNARVGILAYGSLIDDPGSEIAGATAYIVNDAVTTPSKVEFARSSNSRAGAPTLVPVDSGGARVPARIFVLKEGISKHAAWEMLWRRETGRRNAPASRTKARPGSNGVRPG